MNKRFLFGFTIGLAALVAAVLWLLSVVVPDTFGWFSAGWAVVVVAGAAGLAFVLKGLFTKDVGMIKKTNIIVGAALLVVAFLQVVLELALPQNIVVPVIAIVVVAALLLGYVAVGGKKWDTGDNQKVGYKNYYQRKAEAERNAAKNDSDDDK